MDVNSLSKTVTRQHRDCDLHLGPSVPESCTLTTRLPSHSCGSHILGGAWVPHRKGTFGVILGHAQTDLYRYSQCYSLGSELGFFRPKSVSAIHEVYTGLNHKKTSILVQCYLPSWDNRISFISLKTNRLACALSITAVIWNMHHSKWKLYFCEASVRS